MAAVSEQSRALENSLRELRSDLSDPIRVRELGQEVREIILELDETWLKKIRIENAESIWYRQLSYPG